MERKESIVRSIEKAEEERSSGWNKAPARWAESQTQKSAAFPAFTLRNALVYGNAVHEKTRGSFLSYFFVGRKGIGFICSVC